MITDLSIDAIAASVWAVPPLANNADLTVNDAANGRLVRHMENGGVTTVLYGGNANVYGFDNATFQHVAEAASSWAAADTWVIPSVGPDYGKLMDQAAILSGLKYPTAMLLPMFGPHDTAGTERAIRDFSDRAGIPVILYLRTPDYVSGELLGRLADDGTLFAIKYAAEKTPSDLYLEDILAHVPAQRIVSGWGEPPGIVHMQEYGLAGFTAGAVCIAPRRSTAILRALQAGDGATANSLLQAILPLEKLRDQHGAIPVVHDAVRLAGVADTGPILPMLSNTPAALHPAIRAAALALLAVESELTSAAAQ